MRVVHLLAWYFPDSVGGTEIYVAELARRQRAAGMHVAVLAPHESVAAPRTYEWEGVPTFRYPIASADAEVPRHLATQAPDVVHIHSLTTGVTLAQVQAARHAAPCVVFTAHLPALGYTCQRGTLMRWGTAPCSGDAATSPCAACWLQSRGLPRPVARLAAAAGRLTQGSVYMVPGAAGAALRAPALIDANRDRQRALFASIDAFVALNQQALEIVRRNGASASTLALNPLGVGFRPRRKPGPDAAPTRLPVKVGYAGRIFPGKGLDELIRAMRALPGPLPLRLEVRGPASDPAGAELVRELRSLASADSRVTIGDPIPRDGMEQALRALDVVCTPSSGFENGPTVALEAQAVGTPVIGTAVGAMPEFITDGVNGRVLPPGEWQPLRDALAQLASMPSVVDNWRRNLPPVRTMDDVAADYASLYEQVLARLKPGAARRAGRAL